MSVTKEEVKSFIRAVRIKQDAIIAANYATNSQFNSLKNDVADLKNNELDPNDFVKVENGKGLSTNDFTTAEKAIIAELAKQSETGFNEDDIDEVFAD